MGFQSAPAGSTMPLTNQVLPATCLAPGQRGTERGTFGAQANLPSSAVAFLARQAPGRCSTEGGPDGHEEEQGPCRDAGGTNR